MDVRDALAARKSVRAFEPRPVPREVLERVFAVAQKAPSWCNIQPWHVVVTSGDATRRLREGLIAAAHAGMPAPEVPFPGLYPEPYGSHRRECASSLYGAMGIQRNDKAGRWNAWLRNYELFDAPHAAIVSLDKVFGIYGALDIGCWLQSLWLAAVEEGLAMCAQASLATYPQAVRQILPIAEGDHILFGISLGYEAGAAPVNQFRTNRSDLVANVRFVD